MPKARTIAVTGATGRLGRHIVDVLEEMVEWGTQGEVVYVPKTRTQLVAARSVAEALADMVNGAGSDSTLRGLLPEERLLERPRLVDRDDEERIVAGVPKAMRRLRRNDEHLIRTQFDDVVTGRPAPAPFEEDEGLRVGMHVEIHPLARRRPHDEDRDADAGARQSLEERGAGAELHLVEIEDLHRG